MSHLSRLARLLASILEHSISLTKMSLDVSPYCLARLLTSTQECSISLTTMPLRCLTVLPLRVVCRARVEEGPRVITSVDPLLEEAQRNAEQSREWHAVCIEEEESKDDRDIEEALRVCVCVCVWCLWPDWICGYLSPLA